jgi:hypothetical protein
MSDFAPILAREIQRLHAEVLDAMQANGQQATGRTAAAIQPASGPEFARLTGPGYLTALRDGRRPGQRPPIQAIIEWLQAKRLKLNPYAVANNIAARGTRLFRGEDPRFHKPTDTFAAPIAAALPRFRASLVEAARSGLRSDLVHLTTSHL